MDSGEYDLLDVDLDRMSVQELRALRDRIDDAIRAEIGKQRAQRERGTAKPAEASIEAIDLERERDAWAARRK